MPVARKVVRPLPEEVKRLKSSVGVSLAGNEDARIRLGYARLWKHMGGQRVRVMKELDKSKVRWIIAQKRKGATTNHVAQTMDVSTRWVKKLWARYKHTDAGKILYPARMGRPENGLPGHRECSSVPCPLQGAPGGSRHAG